MRILLSAFEAFNNDTINPSEEILKNIEDCDVEKILLPVSYAHAKEILLKKIKNDKFDFILSLGYAASRNEISIEKRACNEMKASIADNDGVFKNGEKINNQGTDYLYTKIDINRIINELNNYHLYESNDAGRFICNEVYYLSLQEMNGNALFIHIPPLDTMKDNGKNIFFLVSAIKEIIKLLKGEK